MYCGSPFLTQGPLKGSAKLCSDAKNLFNKRLPYSFSLYFTSQVALFDPLLTLVWTQMSWVARTMPPRAALSIRSVSTSTPCRRKCLLRKAWTRRCYGSRQGTPTHSQFLPPARQAPWVTAYCQRVGPEPC